MQPLCTVLVQVSINFSFLGSIQFGLGFYFVNLNVTYNTQHALDTGFGKKLSFY
jgi:hypothetical protein